MDASDPLADSAAAPSRKSFAGRTALLVLGCLLLAAAFFGRHLLIQAANDTSHDSDPGPRPRRNAPFIKSADAVVDKMVAIAQIGKDDLVYDLGCGDGRIIVTAALQSGCRGVGFDIDPERVAEAKKNVELHDVGRLVSIEEQDIFKLDLSQADVAVMYLLPWMMQKLPPQFEKMKPGSRIVSHDFYIEGVEPERVAHVMVEPSHSTHYVFLYTVPLRWNPDMPKKPPMQGRADLADAEQAAKEKATAEKAVEEKAKHDATTPANP